MIETSRAEPLSVEFQSGPKGGSGSLSFSIQPMPWQGSEKDVSGNEQSALGAGPSLVTKTLPNSAEGSEIAPHVHSTTQMPGKLIISLVKKQSLYTLLHQNAHTLK